MRRINGDNGELFRAKVEATYDIGEYGYSTLTETFYLGPFTTLGSAKSAVKTTAWGSWREPALVEVHIERAAAVWEAVE